MNPKISVVMPARNAGEFLKGAIDSVLHQSFQEIELVLVDHSSTDDTGLIIQSAAARDDRVVAAHYPPSTLAEVLNHAVEVSRAPIVARMDADDLCHPNRLELQFQAFVEQSVDVLGSQASLISESGSTVGGVDYPLSHTEITAALMYRNPMCHPSVLVRRSVLDAAGGYRRWSSPAEDLDLWLRIQEIGGRFANVKDRVLLYRQHGAQTSAIDPAKSFRKLNVFISAAYRRSGLNDPFVMERESWSRPRDDLLMELPDMDLSTVRSIGVSEVGISDSERITRANACVKLLQPYLQLRRQPRGAVVGGSVR